MVKYADVQALLIKKEICMTSRAAASNQREVLKIHNLFFFIFIILALRMSVFAQDNYLGNIIASDNFGNTYIAGNFSRPTLTFGNFILKNFGGSDIFIAKYNSNGKIVWAKNVGGSNNEKIISLIVEYNGNVSVSASSNSKIINIDNEQLKNDKSGIIFNTELNTNGNVFSAEMEKPAASQTPGSNDYLNKVSEDQAAALS